MSITLPVNGSQRRMVMSLEPDASKFPSKENEMELTVSGHQNISGVDERKHKKGPREKGMH